MAPAIKYALPAGAAWPQMMVRPERAAPRVLMAQRQVPHAAGTFPRCGGACRREPLHIVSGQRLHHLECNPCQRSTGKHESLDGALAEWRRLLGQMPGALREPVQLALVGRKRRRA